VSVDARGTEAPQSGQAQCELLRHFGIHFMRLFSSLSSALLSALLVLPAAASDADQLFVEATIRLDGAVLGKPALKVVAGKNFSMQVGKEGEQRVTLSGMTAPINDKSVALDFTLELEQWGEHGVASRRVSQTVKLSPGERYVVDGVKDRHDKSFGMEISVRRAAP
jgi:hypothetical protein